MKSKLCSDLGIEFPLFAFSHCRDVVVEVSKAGGMGVLGVAGLTPEQLKQELVWIDDHVDGKPYGVDLIVPAVFDGKNQKTKSDEKPSELKVPETHASFVRELLEKHNIDASEFTTERFQGGTRLGDNARDDASATMLDVAFEHPISLIANALGVPPKHMLERSKAEGVPVAALVGTPDQAVKQAKAGVDLIIAAGGEAGGHCGSISTLVLVPEVVDAISHIADIPVLAAGGIVTGRQMAACMSMGAAGAWTGSVWLTTAEAETSEVIKEKLIAASSRDTIRSKSRTGKFSRQLRSAWTDAWEEEDAPTPLPMPHQFGLTERAMRKIHKLADGGHEGARELVSYWVGQGVGMMNKRLSTRAVMYEFMEDFLKATDRLSELTSED
ncbi:nitronate monooxygenase [Sneathiella sp. P13V-1]|uniref:NAD(P)H-dependent flavin oxidoreductase n=1 Tax=Sneathiella sp. P13V-1 TaxID=2697366 RepID=UPI00187B27F9|nr:nitronate monooxygenase [Sneathiella sp. P13V-1]MBE7637493.1 nitronate monooxygenase [Sneathiella sp. P13V-1]